MATTVASQQHQLVSVSGFPGYFATKEGGEIEAEASKVWDGGSLKPETVTAPAETGNITVSKPYRPATHGPLLKRLARQVGVYRTTVSVWDTDPQLGPIGQPVVYADAVLVRLMRPEYDASSSDPGTFELEFAVDGES